MRIRVTNKSRHAGTVLVDDGDHEDDDRPMKQKQIGAGASIELVVTQGGRMQAVGFEVLVEPLPHNPKNPRETKARKR
jgi:hypothetical protein